MSQVQIDREEFEAWARSKRVHYASEMTPTGVLLTFFATPSGKYTVTLGSEDIYAGPDLDAATVAFNEAAKKGGAV